MERTLELAAVAVPASFDEFFAAHHDRLYRALWIVTRDRQDAEELTQDAFLKVWERWERVGSLADPTGYLYRTAMNLFRNRRRRAALALRHAIGTLPRDDAIAAIDDRDAVVRALGACTPAQRAAIVLTDLLDLTSEEAARALRVRPSTVRVLSARARATLRTELGDHDG
ncbi:MAG: RNA polymerase sigma factor [Actinomycetota bacterium]